MVAYLLRFDDACPTMRRDNWNRIETIVDAYDIKPLVGIIPANEDPAQKINPEDPSFWEKVNIWKEKGWSIAMHGYNHVYISSDSGINPLWNRSEFAGVPLEIQKKKIRSGVDIFRTHNINPKFFFAPSHTYDNNTLKALKDESDIRIISDTIATKPYKIDDFIFIPQLGGTCRKMFVPGIWTFCFHPSVMNDNNFRDLEAFLSENKDKFLRFQDINYQNLSAKSIVSKLLSSIYFLRRKVIVH